MDWTFVDVADIPTPPEALELRERCMVEWMVSLFLAEMGASNLRQLSGPKSPESPGYPLKTRGKRGKSRPGSEAR
ncbi:hypothetical protein GFC01_12135 [Desulfofundulus thermobenzoicus]|uniref:Uncharacterized protein n=1 Tax=Desulfofundulus thermobenzoicus TaxID=29376 RepID=A0A6N7IS79_9FIRM|nr:hypothetical protein [Desulfofundulus thermobenzoicus]MQL52995.1 hypothetical protein [Desulfofundulus thermobenzoicus]